jgi:outer membrane protein OmpA-like peptidoglycan-associated protein
MTFRPSTRHLSLLGLIVLAGLIAAGCAIREPQALNDIRQAREALDKAKQAGAADREPDKFKELEKRYLETRGVFYACQDDKASQLAKALIADANALMAPKPAAAAPPPPPPPANRPPKARFKGPAEGEVNVLVTFSAEESSDPDGDKLTYKWDFGDGTTASFTFPNATHRFAKAGSFTVRLTVEDGRGGSDSTTGTIAIIKRVVLSDTKERVLFDFDKADLKPAGQKVVAEVVADMKENPQLRAHLIGHADSIGSDQYNMGLSKRRAESTKNAMVKQGAPAVKITIEWKGESQPIASNDTAEGRAQNRRVEITLRPGN